MRDYANVSSTEKMKRIVLGLWKEFMDTQFDSLIDNIVNKIKAVIAAGSGATRF